MAAKPAGFAAGEVAVSKLGNGSNVDLPQCFHIKTNPKQYSYFIPCPRYPILLGFHICLR